MPIYSSTVELQGSHLEGENPLPFFRNPEHDLEVATEGSLQEQDYLGIGKDAGARYLPYRVQDRYSRCKSTLNLKTITVENHWLRAIFLPEYGARLYSLYHKGQNRELLYCNPVFQLGNLAIRNAWFSGGIEWNVSQCGHTFSTCDPIFSATCYDDESSGEKFLRFYQFERCKNIFWQLDVHLPVDSQQLHVYVKIHNPQDYAQSTYWWTNIALPETPSTRIFSHGSRVLYLSPQQFCGFGQANMPELPSHLGKDASFPTSFPFSNEYFFQNDGITTDPCAWDDLSSREVLPKMDSEEIPWEAATEKDGSYFFECSSPRLRYRKMFCWGSHSGGQRWKDFLSLPSKGDYVEVQAGLAPTQLHSLEIPAHSSWDFVQVFGCGQVERPESIYQEDWVACSQIVQQQIYAAVPPLKVAQLHKDYQQLSTVPIQEILHQGDAWAALEVKRCPQWRPIGMDFLQVSLSSQQQPWLHLLEQGFLAAPKDSNTMDIPWMVGTYWQELLEQSLFGEESLPEAQNWYSYLHLGVCYYEIHQNQKALTAWKKSVELLANPFALRNIAFHYWRQGQLDIAHKHYQHLMDLQNSQDRAAKIDSAFVEEYLELQLARQQYQLVWDFYQQHQERYSFFHDRYLYNSKLAVLIGRAATEIHEAKYLGDLLEREFPQQREGQNLLLDLWYRYQALQQGQEYSQTWREGPASKLVPPRHLDFRMGSYQSFEKTL